MQAALTQVRKDWTITLNNPDPPHGVYTYPYYLRAGGQVWGEFQERVSALGADRFFLVTDSGFPGSLATLVQQRLHAVKPCSVHVFPGVERAKSIETLGQLVAEVKQAGATRHSVIIGLGGGLASNIAGLLAAMLYRGIAFLQIPTTLLNMSDACLSLKQGINTPEGKNILGAYKAPAFVWSDLAFLALLPAREVRAACCEWIKNVVAICPEHFEEVRAMLRPEAQGCPTDWYVRMIELCIEAKLSVMREDAHEKHQALLLEAGHTVGHAIELCGGIPHGMAIGIGLVVEARIAQSMGLLGPSVMDAILTLLRANGSPTAIPKSLSTDALVSIIAHDNKRGSLDEPQGTVPMVLLRGLGQPNLTNGTVLTPVSLSTVREAIDWSLAQPDPFALETAVISAAVH